MQYQICYENRLAEYVHSRKQVYPLSREWNPLSIPRYSMFMRSMGEEYYEENRTKYLFARYPLEAVEPAILHHYLVQKYERVSPVSIYPNVIPVQKHTHAYLLHRYIRKEIQRKTILLIPFLVHDTFCMVFLHLPTQSIELFGEPSVPFFTYRHITQYFAGMPELRKYHVLRMSNFSTFLRQYEGIVQQYPQYIIPYFNVWCCFYTDYRLSQFHINTLRCYKRFQSYEEERNGIDLLRDYTIYLSETGMKKY